MRNLLLQRHGLVLLYYNCEAFTVTHTIDSVCLRMMMLVDLLVGMVASDTAAAVGVEREAWIC